MRFRKRVAVTIAALLVCLLFISILSGCVGVDENVPRVMTAEEEIQQPVQDRKVINPERQAVETQITLYFKHEFADFLVPGQRTVQKGKQSLEELVVEELLKGPAKFGRVCIMPPNIKLLDVIRKDDTVFVNLSEAFKGEIDLAALPGKQNLTEDIKPTVLAEMKRLAIYSIVNSLTEISGVQQVKILINNRSVSYGDLGMMPLITGVPNITSDSAVMPLSRNSRFILNPTQVVHEVFTGLADELNWERAYSFLAQTDIDGEKIPALEQFMEMYTAYISEIAFEIKGEEVRHDGTAFVTADFSVTYANGERREKINYNLRVINEEGIWKLIFPEFLLRPEN
jgi:hypothetical protein